MPNPVKIGNFFEQHNLALSTAAAFFWVERVKSRFTIDRSLSLLIMEFSESSARARK